MRRFVPAAGIPVLWFLLISSLSYGQARHQAMNYDGNPGGVRYLEEGQRPAMIHPTVEAMEAVRTHGPVQQASTANDLTYHGGVGGIGVETAPKIYLVLWAHNGIATTRAASRASSRIFIEESAAVRGSTASPSTAKVCPVAPSSVMEQECLLAIRPEFLRAFGRTTRVLRLHTRVSRSSPVKLFVLPSTSATTSPQAMPALSM